MTSTLYLIGAAALVLIVVWVFETARAAIARVSPPRAEKLVEDDVAGADRLLPLVEQLPHTLDALTLLTTASRTVYLVLAIAVGVAFTGGAVGVVAGAIVGVVPLYLVGDVLARALIEQRPEHTAAALARVVRLPVRLLGPLARLTGTLRSSVTPGDSSEPPPAVSEDRLRDLIEVAGADGTLTASRHAILRAVFEMEDTVVREVMVPRPDMVTVPAKAPLDEVVEVILAAGHSRVPVHGDDRDEITGIVYAKDLLALLHTGGTRPWTDVIRQPLVVPEVKSAENLLRELQVIQVHMAVVVDEYGATVGLVTIEDILEELVGEIVDEHDDELPLVEVLDDDRWRVDARLPVDDLAELVDTRLPDHPWDTVGGLLFGTLGHVATVGEQVVVEDVRLTAELVRGRRISQVLVERCDDADDPQEDG